MAREQKNLMKELIAGNNGSKESDVKVTVICLQDIKKVPSTNFTLVGNTKSINKKKSFGKKLVQYCIET